MLHVRKKLFICIAQDNQEYEKDASPNEEFVKKMREMGIDIYTFIERTWCCRISNPLKSWIGFDDNVALLEITSIDDWFSSVGKKTRNMVRRAEKSCIKVCLVDLTPILSEGIWKIYNETPFRQDRAFPHYGESLKSVAYNMALAKKSTFIGAYLEDELVGFIQIIYGNNIAIISQILSLQRHWDKALNNALIAKAVEVCAGNGNRWLMYGRIGNHPSLDKFKHSNGFKKYPITRYYVPVTWKGKFALRTYLHRELKDVLPEALKGPLIPVTNWVSRNKMRLRKKAKAKV